MSEARHVYDPGQRAFHWLMAAMIFVALGLGVWAHTMAPGTPLRVQLLFFHKSLGMFALALLPLRAVWRLVKGAPPYRAPLAPHVRVASHLAHAALYALMAALPIAGYVSSGAGGHDLPFFGLFHWPLVVSVDKALSKAGDVAHYWLAWAAALVIALHLAAVGWHQWIRRDEVLGRMARAR
ncbi:MAG TPA: cytochrome b [Rhodoblastus sp.]|nr:cytochrome b [Rhodoblastus sp.]